MRKIKVTALIITLALAGAVYAAGNMQEAQQSPDKEKAACCKMDKEDAACCAMMNKDTKAGAKQAACSCCQAHATDGAGCCANCGDGCKDCCKGEACSKEKVAKH